MRGLNKDKKPKKGGIVKHNKKAIIISIVLATIGVASAVYLYQYTHTAKLEKKYNQVQTQLETTNQQLNSTTNDKSKLEQQLKELENTKQDLEKQLQAKLAEKARLASIASQQAQAVPQVSGAVAVKQTYSLPTNQAKAFIYQHESGNNPGAINSQGCRGLGQACPGSKLPCSNSDYACQDAWFTNYAMTRYGSWEAAYQWWVQHSWW